MNNETLSTPVEALDNIETLRQKATVDLPAVARSLEVKPFDEESKGLANRIIKGIKIVLAKIDGLCDPSITAAKASLTKARELKAELADPPNECLEIIRGKMNAAVQEEGRIRREQEAKAEAERRRVEDERRKIEAEQRRVEEEAIRKAAEAERLAKEAEARASRAKSEEARKKAQEEADKQNAAAQRILQETIEAPKPAPVISPIPTPIIPPKQKGTVKRWKARIIHPELVPRQFCVPDEVALNKYATEKKEAAVDTVPGVEFYAEETFRSY